MRSEGVVQWGSGIGSPPWHGNMEWRTWIDWYCHCAGRRRGSNLNRCPDLLANRLQKAASEETGRLATDEVMVMGAAEVVYVEEGPGSKVVEERVQDSRWWRQRSWLLSLIADRLGRTYGRSLGILWEASCSREITDDWMNKSRSWNFNKESGA
jgi:hypothetical protein